MTRSAPSSPRRTARAAGFFYLLMGVLGGGAVRARRGLVVPGDAAATAANIQTHLPLYLAGYAGDLLMVASYVVVVALLYRLFKPVNAGVASAAAALGLTGCVILAIAYSYELVPLTLLGSAPYLAALPPEQRAALSYVFLKSFSQGYGVSLVFFAFYLVLTGWLVLRSAFMPRFIGAFLLLGITGLAFLAPPFAMRHFAWTVLGSSGELLLTIWLLVKGVDADAWHRQAAAARAPEPVPPRVPAA